MRSAIYFAPFVLGVASATNLWRPSAVIDTGVVVGVATSLPSSRLTVNKFLGIPYAEPPVGSKRFLPPTPRSHFGWKPLDASRWGHICYQQNPAVPYDPNESEDCLTLNVYTPARHSKTKRPVLFWIHGGDLQFGTGGQDPLDGTSFATHHDIVVVTINYRVNAFGFPNSPALPLAKTNLGFLDQRLALDWVQRNIHAFNGDRKKVTIGGESSGASSVDRLVNSFAPPLTPPFRAAGESSGQASVSAFERRSGPVSWAALVSMLGCTKASPEAELKCMRAADAVAIRNAVVDNMLDFSPVNDGVTQHALPYLNSRAAGNASHVPLYIGTSAQEGTILAAIYGIDPAAFTEDQLVQLISLFTGGDQALITQFTMLVRSVMQTSGLGLFYAAALVYTELVYQCPAKLVSQAVAQSGLPAWRYYQNESFPNIKLPGDLPTSTLGAYHTADLQLIWGTFPKENSTLREAEMSKSIQAAWAGFISDPWGKGPGFARVNADASGGGLACFGCGDGTGFSLINEPTVDALCPYFEALYLNVTTPYF